jgi:hypothetical protein
LELGFIGKKLMWPEQERVFFLKGDILKEAKRLSSGRDK